MISDGQLANAANFNAAFLSRGTSSSDIIENLSLSASVAGNNLTIAVKTLSGSDPSTTDFCTIGMRSATLTSGSYSLRTITAATSIVVPSGATLGATSGMNTYIWVWAMDNAGVIELAVSGSFQGESSTSDGSNIYVDGVLNSTTAITSGSTSMNTRYSTTLRNNLPCKLIGRLIVNEATAGVYASAPTSLEINPKPMVCVSSSWQTFTPTGNWSSNTTYAGKYRRNGEVLELQYYVTLTGAPTSATLALNVPFSLVINANRLSGGLVATNLIPFSGGTIFDTSAPTVFQCIVTPATTTTLNLRAVRTETGSNPVWVNSTNVVTQANPMTFATGDSIYAFCSIPITGWNQYGP